VKIQLLILIFLSFSAVAAPSCDDYKFQGVLRLQENAFFLYIHEGTLSEIKIHIPKDEELKFLPYHDEIVNGKFEDGTFTNLDFAVPDGQEFLVKKGDCQ
jgi:hypothetical protein